MKLSSIYNKINELLRHLFKPFPILLGIIVSVIEINDYLTPDPMDRVLAQIEESQKALNELKVVDIPDSLQTDMVKEARILQQKLIAYAKIINSCNAISSNNPLNLQWQIMRFEDVIKASKTAGNSMVDFIGKLGYKHRNEFDLAVMYAPNISFSGENFEKELDNTTKKLTSAKTDKEKLDIINTFIASDGVREFIKNRNDLIRSAFEYLNVVQLSLVYNLDIENLSHVTNGK
jgi:hypothetical protein